MIPVPLDATDRAAHDAWLHDLAACMEAAADDAQAHRDADPLLDVEHDEAPALPWESEWTPADALLPALIDAPALCEEPPPAWMERCARGEYPRGVGSHGVASIRWRGGVS